MNNKEILTVDQQKIFEDKKRKGSHCSYQYWTGLCSIMVLEEAANGEEECYAFVSYAQAFFDPSQVHIYDWDGNADGLIHVTNRKVNDNWNMYFLPHTARAKDWFCVYSWEFNF